MNESASISSGYSICEGTSSAKLCFMRMQMFKMVTFCDESNRHGYSDKRYGE